MLYKLVLLLVLISSTLFGGSVPRVTGDQPGSKLIGETFSQSLCFDNNGTATGFEPQFEIVTPVGIKLTEAAFYGNPTISHQETCMATDCNVSNPIIGQPSFFSPIDGNESYYILDFPIGSFSTEWPEQCMDLTFELESSGDHVQPGNPLDIKTVGVFSLGETPLDDGNYTYGTEHDLTVIPNVYTIEKSNNAPEGERATGKKYPIRATITVDIAKDENLTNLQVVDDLDIGMQFTQMINNAGCSETQLPSTISPGGTLELDCSSVTGVLGPDLNITYEYYIPEVDANSDPVLGSGCQWKPLINLAHATAEHDFNNTQTPLSQIDANSTVTAKAIAMLKTSSIYSDASPIGFGPGDQIEYTLTMDISGYATQSNIVISDTIGDGQSYAVNTLNSYTLSPGGTGNFDAGNINVTYDPSTGTSLIEFNLSKQLSDDGKPSTVDANTTITVTFITTVDDDYKVINNQKHISMGDVVENSVILDTTMNGTTCPHEDSHTSNTVATEQMTKSIYAVNGDKTVSAPYQIHPGDRVTYRLKSIMPVESFYDFKLLDYLPIPLFKASEITSGPDAAETTPGTWAIGPDNNYSIPPVLSVDSTQNSITWSFGDDNTTQSGTALDLLFTVTATNEPMADALTLANIGGTKYKNAANENFGTADLVDVITQQPLVDINKTIIETTNNQGQSFPTVSLDKVDANDTITYKIRLENTGHAIAYDVNVTDRFEQDGTLGQGLHSCIITSEDTNGTLGGTTGDLFGGTYTIERIDARSYFDINYTCTVNQDANPGDDINNTATLKAYSSAPNGPNFVAKKIESKTKLMLTSKMEIVKNIVASSIPDTNPDNNLNQGEIVNFEINVTLGEGTYTNYALTDNTCTGLALQSQSSNVLVSGTTVTVLGTGGSVDGNLSYGCEKQAITSGSNTATVNADLMGSKTASTNWAVVDPVVITSKNMNPSQADAGDTVTVTMNWTNDTAHPAYKCSVIDPLNTSVFDINSVSMTTTPAGYSCNVVGNDVQCIYTGDLTLPCPDGPAKFTVNVRDDVNTSGNLVNELSFNGVTLPDGHPGENNTTINGSVESNATDTLELLSPAQPVKIFTSTSENFTDPGNNSLNSTPPVAIGEVIDVNITYGFFEGTTLNVNLDELFLDGGRLVYVPGTMTISRDDNNLSVEDSVINALLTGVNTPVAVPDTSLAISNTGLVLHVGDVLNGNNSQGTSEKHLTLSFRVKVQNKSAVQAGELIRDRGQTRFKDSISGSDRTSTSDIRSARTFEPLPTIEKDVNQSSVQAGTNLTYSLKVCNDETNSSNFVTSGFNWTVSDHIPDDILFTPGSITVNTGSTGATVDTSASSGQDINATIDRLDKGECIFISYEAIVQQSAQFGQVMTNTANFQTTSLPGDYGTAGSLAGLATQEPGEVNGKRTGTGGVNDLFGQDDATVVMNKNSLNKILRSPKPYYAIGEEAQYQIRIDMTRGLAKNFVVNDILPAGLELNTSSLVFGFVGGVFAEHNPPVVTQNANVVSFDYGDLNVTTPAQLVIDYNARVTNVLSNQDGVSLRNEANATFNDPNNPGQTITVEPGVDPLPVKVGEPNLFMDKQITAGAVKAQAGSVVSWEVTIANNGHTTAYATDWNDTLPSHLAQISNAVLTLNGTSAVLSGTSTALTSTDLIENNTTLSLPPFDLPVGSTITVTFDSIVQNDAVAGETQTNNTSARYLSILGADGSVLGGRNSDTCGDDDDNSTLNNYCESKTADLIIDAGIAIDKHLQGTVDHFTIGEQVTYEMRVSLIEGITPNVVLTDTLPAGLQYVSHTCQDAGGTTMQFSCNLSSTSPVSIDFGDVINPADGNNTNDYIDVELTVLVENVIGNQNGYKPENGDTAGTLVTVTSDANSSAVTVPVLITITEPDLNVTKRVTPDTQATGDVVTYYIHLAHSSTSTADAYDINFTDTLPADLTYIPGSVTGAPNFVQNGQVLTFSFAYLGQSDTRDISYKARIAEGASIAVPLVNSLDTVFSGAPDANGSADGYRNGTDGIGPNKLNNYALHTEAPVRPNHDVLTPVKSQDLNDTNNDGLVNAGDILEYNLSVTNGLTYDVGDINITDMLDSNVTLMLNSIMIDGIAYGDNNATDWSLSGYWYNYASSDVNISYNSDTNYFEVYWQNTLLSGHALNITYDVVINDGTVTTITFDDGSTIDLAAGATVQPGTVIDNNFTVDSNRTIPATSNEVNVTTDQRGIAGIPLKQITGSDQNFTTLPNVAVGEVIDVNLTFAFSGGITRDVVLRDNYDRAQFSFVTGSETLTESNVSAISATNALIVVPDSNGFSVSLGDVVNTHYEDLNMTETLTLSFKLQVENNVSVNAGDDLEDRADITYLDYNRSGGQPDRNITLQSLPVSAHVLEPLPSISKINSNAAAQAGDPVTYTVKICNDEANSATDVTSAFDWTAIDVLDANLHPQAPVRTYPGSTGAIMTALFSGQTLFVTVDELTQGECVNVEYDVVIDTGIADGVTIGNTINMQTTSLPGTVTGERTGSATPPLNDLHKQASSNIVINTASITKEVVAQQTRYAIGESVEYNVTIALPESVKSLELNDTLPAGLVYNTGSAQIINLSGLSIEHDPVNVTQNGNIVTFDFGNVNTSGPQTFYLEFNATVDNVVSNQENTSLVNDVNMSYLEPDNNVTLSFPNVPAPAIVVGEPTIFMNKTVTAGQIGSQAGDTISYSVTLQNTGSTKAFAIDWSDILPEHLAQISDVNITGTAYLSGTNTLVDSADAIISTVNAADDKITLPAFDLNVSQTLTIAFNTVVQGSVEAKSKLLNNTTATWKSILGFGERNGTDGIGGALNNYAAESNATVDINAGIAIAKKVDKTEATIGDTVTYTLSVNFILGVTPEVVVKDVLPSGMTYVSYAVQSTNPSGLTYSNNIKSGTGQDVIITLGDVNNTATINDSIDIEIVARVDNVLSNQDSDTPDNGGGTALGTPVTVTYNTPGVGISEANVSVPVSFTIVEPNLNVVKSVTPATQALGDQVTYTIHVENNGTSDAYDINFTDTLDVGLIYVPNSAIGATVTQNGQVLTFSIAHLLNGASSDISYKSQIDANAVAGTTLNNTLETVFSGKHDANGSVDGYRNGTDGVGADATTLNNYALQTVVPVIPSVAVLTPVKSGDIKVDTNHDGFVNAGDILEYNLSTTNNLGYSVGELNVTDVLDPNVTLVLNSININGTAVGNDHPWSFDGTWYRYANASNDINLTYNIDTNYFEVYWQQLLNSGSILDITFDVKINDGLVTDVSFTDGNSSQLSADTYTKPGTVIDNTFIVDSNRTVPATSNEVNVTTQVADFNLIKVQSGGVPIVRAVGDVITYTITIENNGTVTLTDINITEFYPGTGAGTLSGPLSSDGNTSVIHVGETWTYTAKYTVTQADVDARVDLVNIISVDTNQTGTKDANASTPVEKLGSWSGHVSKDTNGNGIGDLNLAGVTIKLYTDPNGDGDPSDGVLVGTTTTNSSGNYSFIKLIPRDYVANETQPTGLLNVSENEGGTDSDKPDNGIINSIAGIVSPNENDVGNDFVEKNGIFDLALLNRTNTVLTPGPYVPRHAVVYRITIINQGTLDAYDVQINDYIPTGITLNDTSWTSSGGVATLKTPIAYIAAGKSISVDITFRINANLHSTNIVNNAEIRSASNILGIPDIDSIPGNEDGTIRDPVDDDIGNSSGFDDYDFAAINVKCSCHVAVPCECMPILTLAVSSITANSAQLKWNYTGNCDGFEIYSNGQFVTYVNANTNSYKITNLKGKTQYTVKVITVLGDGGDIYKTLVFKTGDDYGWLPAIYHILSD